jgi:hypothetical protein
MSLAAIGAYSASGCADERCDPDHRQQGPGRSRPRPRAVDSRRSRRDRGGPPADRARRRGNASGAAVSHAVAALGGWRRGRSMRLYPCGGRTGRGRRFGRLVRLDRQQHRTDRRLHGPCRGTRYLGRSAGNRRLGPAERLAGDRGGSRLSGHRPTEFRQRLPPFQLDGRARAGRPAGRLIAAERQWPPDDPQLALPGEIRNPARQLEPDRPARHGLRIL